MTGPHHMTCTCGKTRWRVDAEVSGRVVTCYCADCQAYAIHLGVTDRYLDADGGTRLRQTIPAGIDFPDGTDTLGLLRLGPRGLFRWHTTCCNTPVANTLTKPGLPFVGVVLPAGDDRFGPARAVVQTRAARRPVKERGMLAAVASLFTRAARARLSGQTATPFFGPDGAPIVAPVVPSRDQRDAATPR